MSRPMIAIVRKEFIDIISSSRFWMVLTIFLIMILLSGYQGVQSYKKELDLYGESIARDSTSTQFTLNVPKPTLLSAFKVLLDSIAIVGALLSVIIGYNSISGERKKVLKLLLSYPVYRDSVINAKFISRMLVISIVLVISSFISVGGVIYFLDILPSVEEVVRIFLFVLSALSYMYFFLALSIFFSIIAKEESNALFASIIVWFVGVVLISRIAYFISSILVPIPSMGSINDNVKEKLIIEKLNLINTVQSISPSFHFRQFSEYMLIPFKTGEIITVDSYNPLPLKLSFMYSGHHLLLLIVGTILLFIASYIKFMREDI